MRPGERVREAAIEVRCACGREHGNQQIERFDVLGGFDWEGDECGPLVRGGGRPEDHWQPANHRTRLFAAPDDTTYPAWRGECLRCGLHVRIRGDRLVDILDHWLPIGGCRIELGTISRMAHTRR